ncbi:MAG: glycosyltransferase family 4 protein [Flavobacteriales bacterium]|nr:glycosyltransferase family 4 protein [Flavobacteriales bacterium]
MIRILYIGDPSSVHDIKWVSYFSTRPDFEAHFLVQEHEMHLITAERKRLFNKLNITIEGPIKSYSLWRFWDNLKSIGKIREVVKKRRIDILHPLFATPFSLWTPYANIPSVITTRGSDIMVVLSNLRKQTGLKKLHGSILLNRFKKAFIKSAALTCTSQGQSERINEIFETKIKAEIIRTGVNVDEIWQLEPKLDLPKNFTGKKIIFLPRYVRPIYRTELQLEALNMLPLQTKNKIALLLIKGNRTEDSYMLKIQKQLDEIGISYHVYDSLTQHEMWSAFKLSALTIMTPKTDGTPNSALEAMAANCPLILGSFGYDIDLFSEKYCFRMKSDSSEELNKLISKALSNYPETVLKSAFENVALKGNRLVEMERLRNVYSEIVER